jgi:hypothetical protein
MTLSCKDFAMRTLFALVAVIVAGLFVAAPASSFDLAKMLGGSEEQDLHTFKLIHVDDLKAFMADSSSHVHIFDANVPETRAAFGMIPGAKLLSSDDDYNVATELPANRNAKLVFYCTDTH